LYIYTNSTFKINRHASEKNARKESLKPGFIQFSFMKKCAIVIGINNVKGLTPLSGAVAGAQKFREWADSQNFDTYLLIDDKSPVTVSDVSKVIHQVVYEKTYSQLVIYFAGHGVLKSATDEQWLLTNANSDPNEAISLLPSRMLARRAGIPHIVFISDACRSKPETIQISEVTGSIIFPTVYFMTPNVAVDVFYATVPGYPAYEITIDEASKNYRGIYSECLLEALYGKVPHLLSDLTEGKKEFSIILAYELLEYLTLAVPKAAASFSIHLNQQPDGEISSHRPKYIAIFDKPKRKSYTSKEETMHEWAFLNPKNLLDEIYNDEVAINPAKPPFDLEQFEFEYVDNMPKELKPNIANLTDAHTQIDLIEGTGFIIIGARKISILPEIHHRMSREKDKIRIWIDGDYPYYCILKLENGTGIPLAILPDFIGIIYIENGEVTNINYTPSRNNERYNLGIERLKSIEEKRAAIATAAKFGLLELTGNRDYLSRIASYIRTDKAFDPTLGLYSVYAYARAGLDDQIKSVHDYMSLEPEPILFDVQLLKDLIDPDEKLNRSFRKVTPFCPLLTQGWSYLTIYDFESREDLKELAKYLIPGLWTTFNSKGVKFINKLIKRK